MSTYLFENAGQQAGQRFSSLETLYDPWKIRHLEVTGIGVGWQCWDVGAGGGSIVAWLAERSGKSGQVLVSDLDLRLPSRRLRSSATTLASIHRPLG